MVFVDVSSNNGILGVVIIGNKNESTFRSLSLLGNKTSFFDNEFLLLMLFGTHSSIKRIRPVTRHSTYLLEEIVALSLGVDVKVL